MSKKECEIVKDLLPLYVDNVLSESSREFVEEHIVDCKDCKNKYLKMTKEINIPEDRESNIIKKVGKRIKYKKMIFAIISVFLTIVILIGGYKFSNSYEWIIPYSPNEMKVVKGDNGISFTYSGDSDNFEIRMDEIEEKEVGTLIISINYKDTLFNKYINTNTENRNVQYEIYNLNGVDSNSVNGRINRETIKNTSDYMDGEKVKYDRIKIYYLDRVINEKEEKSYMNILFKEGHLIYEK